jgi:hypothetical protein
LPTIGERFGEWFESPHYGKEGLGWLRKKRIQKKRLRLSTRFFASFFAPKKVRKDIREIGIIHFVFC